MVPFDAKLRPVRQERQESMSRIEIAFGGGHRLVVHEGTFSVFGPEGGAFLRDATASIRFGQTRLGIDDPKRKIEQMPDGLGVTMSVPGDTDRPGFDWMIRADQDEAELRISQTFHNTTGEPIRLENMVALDSDHGIAGASPGTTKAFNIGHMTWAAAVNKTVADLDIPDDHRYTMLIPALHEDSVIIPYDAHLTTADGQQVLLGFTTTDRYKGAIELKRNEPGVTVHNYANVDVPAGESRQGEELLMVFGKGINEANKIHGQEVARRRGYKKPEVTEQLQIECTFSSMFFPKSATEVKDDIVATAKLKNKFGLQAFLMDDTGCMNVPYGDWDELDTFLAGTFAQYADESAEYSGINGYSRFVESHNMLPGAWMAPGFVYEGSKLMDDILHEKNGKSRDWLVKDESGELMREDHVWDGKLYPQYLLDVTHPEAANYIREQIRIYKKSGIKLFKVDFFYTFQREAERFEKVSSIEAFNQAEALLMEEIDDPESIIIKCGAPFIPSAVRGRPKGKIIIRAGSDVLLPNSANSNEDGDEQKSKGMLADWGSEFKGENYNGGGARNASVKIPTCAQKLQEVFDLIDGDSLVTRTAQEHAGSSTFHENQIRYLVAINRWLGARRVFSLGDDPARLTPWQEEMILLSLDGGEVGETILWSTPGHPEAGRRVNGDGNEELILMNPHEQPREIHVPLAVLPIDAGVQGRELYTGEQAQFGDSIVRTLPPRAAEVWQFVTSV